MEFAFTDLFNKKLLQTEEVALYLMKQIDEVNTKGRYKTLVHCIALNERYSAPCTSRLILQKHVITQNLKS